jgi:hypothetical protein
VTLNIQISQEIARISDLYRIDAAVLEEFATYVLDHAKATSKSKTPKSKTPKSKPTQPKPATQAKATKSLSLTQLKTSVLEHFGVADTKALKKSAKFVMSTSGMDISLTGKDGWGALYRKFIGILPGEENESGYGCINGIDIFKYSMPWKVLGLEPATASQEDIKTAYRNLSKVYHPDVPGSGDSRVFERLTQFYQSLTEQF